MSEAQLRALCQQLLHDLDILPPLTPETLCRRLAAARGRGLKLVAEELYTTASVGHLFSTARRDVIAYQRSAPRDQQAHVIYHEVIHLVCGHLEGTEALICGALEESPDSLSTAAGQGLYARWQEWEAETGATILSELATKRPEPCRITKDAREPEQRIAAAFGVSSSGWR